ncbi:MAG: SsrA-binding protein, partial [Bacteroidota bacterium]
MSNRKAAHHFFISVTWEAGIMLTGTEIKAVREGKANL